MSEIVLGIRLKADGSDLVGQIKVSEDAFKKLHGELGRGGGEAAKLNAEHQNLARTMSEGAGKIGAYTAGWTVLTDVIMRSASAVKDYIKESALLAARHETLGVVMAVVGRNAGYSAGEMNTHAEAVRKSGITMNESREVVIKLAQANIDLSLASQLARGAQDAGRIANINSSEALERMIHGITSAQTEVLRTMGINVNFEDSYKSLAKQLNTTTEQLSEQEKVQARAAVTLAYLSRLEGVYAASLDTAGGKLLSVARYEKDLKTIRGEIWNEMLIIAVEKYTESLKGANEEARRMSHEGSLKEWGRDALELFAALADAGLTVGKVFRQIVESTATVAVEGAAFLGKVATSNVFGYAVNKWYGDPNEKLQGFAQAFSARANSNAESRWGGSNTPFSDALAARIAQKDAADRQAAWDADDPWAPMPPKPGTGTRPSGGLRAGGTSTDGGLQPLLDGLTRQLELQKDSTELEKLDLELRSSKHDKITGWDRDELRLLAALIDAKNAEKRALEDLVKAADAHTQAEAQRQATYTSMFMSMSEQAKAIDNETKAIGMSARAREENAEMMRLQATYHAALAKVAEGDLETQQKLTDEYNRQKAALPDLVRARSEAREADAAQKKSLDDFNGLWSTVESTGKQVFVSLFSHGDDTFKNLGKSLKASVVDLLYQLTARKWIINIGTSIAGSLGLTSAASAANAATGSGSGGGIVSSMANLFKPGGEGILGGSQFVADIGNFFGNIGTITEAGSTFGLMDAIGGFAAAHPLGLALGALGLIGGLGGLFGGSGKKPAVLTGKDLPAGRVAYGGGLSGTMYGNDSNQGYRWAGEEWSGVFRSEIDALYADVERMGRLLGRDVSGVRGVSATVSTGTFMDANEILPTVLAQAADELAKHVIPNLKEFAQANETASQTLMRMAAEAQQAKLGSIFGLMGGALALEQSTSDLWLSNLSPLTAGERMSRSNARYAELLGGARGGDVRSMASLSQFVRENLGEAAGFYGTSTPEYRALFEGRQSDVAGLVGDTLNEQSIQFAEMGLTLKDIATNTKDLDARIAAKIEAAIAAYQEAQAAISGAQTRQVVQAVTQTAQQTAFVLESAASARFGVEAQPGD